MRVAVEVCASTLAEVKAAADAGVDSVELCVAIQEGGLTPSLGIVVQAMSMPLPGLRVLVRPRPGDFSYSAVESEAICWDVKRFLKFEHPEPVVGGLTPDGALDEHLMVKLLSIGTPQAWTFHRAIDHSSDPLRLFGRCIELGFGRVLTSGGASNALQGVVGLRAMVELARGRIRVAAAAGVNPTNVVELVERTGVGEVHFSATRGLLHAVGAHSNMGLDSEPDLRKIDGVLNALAKAGLR